MPLRPVVAVVILDTGTRRGLVDSAYNERRDPLRSGGGGVGRHRAARRDDEPVSMRGRTGWTSLPPAALGHVISENERVLLAAAAMRDQDPQRLGELMIASHISMRDDFEISSDALNAMVEIGLTQPGCYGARMTGGGFAGCAVALVAVGAADDFAAAVHRLYQEQTGLEPKIYITKATAGAALV